MPAPRCDHSIRRILLSARDFSPRHKLCNLLCNYESLRREIVLWSFTFTVFLASLWMLGSIGTVEADIRGRHGIQKARGEIEQLLPSDITPTAAFVGTVPAVTFPVCRPPVFSAAPVVLFLLRPSAVDEPA